MPSKPELLNAIFYQLRAGSVWQLQPHDLPPWRSCVAHSEGGRVLVKLNRVFLPLGIYKFVRRKPAQGLESFGVVVS